MQTSAWLILLFPLAGTVVNGLGYRVLPGKTVGWIGTAAILGAFVAAIATFAALQDRGEEHRQVVYVAWDYANTVVVGDVGLVLGTYFIFRHSGTLDFLGTFDSAKGDFASHGGALTAGLILVLVGAFAKSAQVPLHTWLPDAMEGPTPVSALIHAATMVTAGVYLIARMHPLFERAPAAADVGAIIGCATLLFAGTVGLVVTDLKRVIAYSTMSQIGYMIMGVSSAAYVAGMFHLMTHAFFKALLFMAAGSVISAMGGEQNLDRMGGFRKI